MKTLIGNHTLTSKNEIGFFSMSGEM